MPVYLDGREATLGRAAGVILVAASGAPSAVKERAWRVCDGTADDVEIQAALDVLPSGGGRIGLSEGTFTLAAQIARAIDNVSIEGVGASTLLNLNASTAVISAGSQVGWSIQLLSTDAGGVDIDSAGNSMAAIWKGGIYLASVKHGATPPSGYAAVIGALDQVRMGRYAGGGRVGFAVGNDGHFSLFSDDFSTEIAHLDGGLGGGVLTALGMDLIGGSHSTRPYFPKVGGPALAGFRAAKQLGLPRRDADPAVDGDSGTATSGSTALLVDTGKTWTPSEWVNYICIIRPDDTNEEIRLINANTPISLTPNSVLIDAVEVGDAYIIAQVFAGDMWYDITNDVMKVFNGTNIKTLDWS